MKKSVLTAIASVIFLYGCAAPPEVEQMSINDGIDVSAMNSKGVKFNNIRVTGGGNTEFIMGSRVERAGVQEALTQTLNKFQLGDKNSIYSLDVDLRNCSAPLAGFVLEVRCLFEYKISSSSGLINNFSVESVGSANSLDGFNQYHLILRKANERAVRENIRKFLENTNDYYKKQ